MATAGSGSGEAQGYAAGDVPARLPSRSYQSVVSMGLSAANSRPSGTPAMRNSARDPKLACTRAPTVKSVLPCGTMRDDVPEPPLKE